MTKGRQCVSFLKKKQDELVGFGELAVEGGK